MAFKSIVSSPQTGQIFPKGETYVKVVSTGSSKELVDKRDENGNIITDKDGNNIKEYVWILGFKFMVYFSRTKKLLFGGDSVLQNYNPNEPCEQQIYECVKKMKWQYWGEEPLYDGEFGGEDGLKFEAAKEVVDGKIWYPMFLEIENC